MIPFLLVGGLLFQTRCKRAEDFSEVSNEIFGYGERKIYQEEFTLVPGWDSTVWDVLKLQPIATIRKELRESTSSNWELYRDIGRKWILDETGSISGTAHDFTT